MGTPAAPGKIRCIGVEGSLRFGLLIVAALVLALDVRAFFSWSERRGVYDDICYLRQAHLFQRFGLAGIHTDIVHDDDAFFRDAQRAVGFAFADDPNRAICHNTTKIGKRVLQYPPGTGFLMAAFPAGSQVAWLFTVSSLVVMGAVILIVSIASIRASIVAAGLFGLCALYFMVNPTKASYSMAPTTAVCIVAAILAPLLFISQKTKHRALSAAAIGALLGLSVSFRTANLLLVAGYATVLGFDFLRRREASSFGVGAAFAAAYLVGLAPSLVANRVNAGSVFSTTYGSQDVVPADLTFSVVRQYLMDMQGYLAIGAIVATLWMFRHSRHLAPVAIVGVNLAVNLGFFFTHPIFTQYYIMPIMTLTLWSLFAQWLFEQRLQSG